MIDYDCGKLQTGDRHQRYEVTYFDPSPGEMRRRVFGWANTMEGVNAMIECIKLHPTMDDPKFTDRMRSAAQEP